MTVLWIYVQIIYPGALELYACEGIPPALPIYYFQYVQFEKQAIHGRINTKIKATKEIRRHAEIRFAMSLHYNRCLARKKNGYGNNVYVFLQCVFAIWIGWLAGGWIDGKTPLITSRLALMHWTWRESAEQWQENGQDPRPSPTTSTTNTTTTTPNRITAQLLLLLQLASLSLMLLLLEVIMFLAG